MGASARNGGWSITAGKSCGSPCAEPRTARVDPSALRACKEERPHPEEPCAARRLEGWPRVSAAHPSFETHRYAMLLRMRSRFFSRPKEGCERTTFGSEKSSGALLPQRLKSIPGGGELFQQRRGAVAVVAGGMREGREPVPNIPKPDAVGVMHRPAAIDREAVAVDPDHVDIAGALCDALVQNTGALIDHREQQTFDHRVLAECAARDAALRRGIDDQLLDLGIRFRGARAWLIKIEAARGLLAVAAALA